ncbi:MAG TPA: hypothetical protein VMU48_04625 [Terracidiphilus sp.]|nr:hypothetical protein [Terracidiphilus sp.]
MMSLDNTLWLAGIVTEAVVIALLIYRRMWRLLPLFCVYCAWDLLSNAVSFGCAHYFATHFSLYIKTYLIQTIIDAALQFGVLVELSWSVLRPVRSALPRYAFVAVGLLILAIGLATWQFASFAELAQLGANFRFIVHVQYTEAILRILFFLGLAGCSQLLSIGWRDRELQVATGLGIYSLVSLGIAMLQTHQTTGTQYGHLNQFIVASYVISLLYWVFSFAQKQAERREFTPQMQNMLLAVAGVARADRMALARSNSEDGQSRRNP